MFTGALSPEWTLNPKFSLWDWNKLCWTLKTFLDIIFCLIFLVSELLLENLQVFKGKSESCSVVSNSLWPHGLYSPWNSLGQNTGVGSLSFLQGICLTQGLDPVLPHCRQILYQLSHKGSPKILEWVAYPFSRGSSQPRNWTGVSCIRGGLFTNWAIREALQREKWYQIPVYLNGFLFSVRS